MNDNAPFTKVICREIGEADLAGVADLLARGFPSYDRAVWNGVCRRLADRPWPDGFPRFGWMLESNGRVVGSIFTIFTALPVEGCIEIRCSTSSWYVEHEFRGQGMRLARQAAKHKDVIYFNPTPGAGTRPVLDHLGFAPYCRGHFLVVAAASAARGPAHIWDYTDYNSEGSKLSPADAALLADHSNYGCISLVCETGDTVLPFVFLRRRQYVPYAQLIYCRRPSDIIKYAGPIGRHLAKRGIPLLAIDCYGPIRGLIGHFMDNKPKFFKGQKAPRLGDLAYSELAFFGDYVSGSRSE
jgi:hypothetical protein